MACFWVNSLSTKAIHFLTTHPVSTNVLEFSLLVAPVVSLGHMSTTAFAAATLGSMTATVTGFSVVQGFASCLDTFLPGAWTSKSPELVGLWSQRMIVVMALTLLVRFRFFRNCSSEFTADVSTASAHS